MGLIIAVKEQDHIVVGADSDHRILVHEATFMNPNNFKFWRMPEHPDVIMAYVGPYKRIANVLRMTRLTKTDAVITHDLVVREVVPSIATIVKSLSLSKSETMDIQGRYMLAVDNRILMIESDGTVVSNDDFVALGTGKKFAYGSLRTTANQNLPATERILLAVRAAYEDDYKISFPLIIGNNAQPDVDIILRDTCYDRSTFDDT
jgi:ATP-dependent protease HslVU (ClpYQ) peptidase subunit